jgi:hypothetical protein
MSHFKTFLLGMATAYGIYYITKKREDGTSILDDLKDNPSYFLNKAKDYTVGEIAGILKKAIY